MSVELPAPPCSACCGACCRQTGDHKYAVQISPEEPFIPGEVVVVVEKEAARVLPYVEGKCVHLADDNRCQIYDQRPILCRQFNCISGYGCRSKGGVVWHGFFLEDNAAVVELIEATIPDHILANLVADRVR